jgi:hypothetical protein
MNTYGGVEVQLRGLLSLALGGGKCSASYSGFITYKKSSIIHIDYKPRVLRLVRWHTTKINLTISVCDQYLLIFYLFKSKQLKFSG